MCVFTGGKLRTHTGFFAIRTTNYPKRWCVFRKMRERGENSKWKGFTVYQIFLECSLTFQTLMTLSSVECRRRHFLNVFLSIQWKISGPPPVFEISSFVFCLRLRWFILESYINKCPYLVGETTARANKKVWRCRMIQWDRTQSPAHTYNV